jgi:anti-sigma B factor antagonist
MTDLDLTITPSGVDVVGPGAQLDVDGASKLSSVIADLVAEGHIRLVIDLSETDYIDAAGVEALLSGWRLLRARGGDLRLSAATEPVRGVLDHPALDRLKTDETVDAAIDAFD